MSEPELKQGEASETLPPVPVPTESTAPKEQAPEPPPAPPKSPSAAAPAADADSADTAAAYGSDSEFAGVDFDSPAYRALQANKALKVTKIKKTVGKQLDKVPKPKRIVKGTVKKAKRKERANIKGKVIDGEHEQYVLTIGMMLGIRVSVGLGAGQAAVNFRLTPEDFDRVDKMVFPPAGRGGQFPTPPHSLSHTFKFKDYCPNVFRALRGMNNVDPASYMLSICGDFNFIQFIANSRSGQFFFYSHDGKYMIKTQTKEENKFLRRILPSYYKYLVANPNSLITRFYGMHRVKMYHLRRKLHFVVMHSVFDTPEKIHTMFDLKGSTHGREASQKDRETGGVLKDLDLEHDKINFKLGSKRKVAFLDQLTLDAQFLAELKIMDYSLLVGVHHRDRRQRDAEEDAEKEELGALHEDAAAPTQTPPDAAEQPPEHDIDRRDSKSKKRHSDTPLVRQKRDQSGNPPPPQRAREYAVASQADGAFGRIEETETTASSSGTPDRPDGESGGGGSGGGGDGSSGGDGGGDGSEDAGASGGGEKEDEEEGASGDASTGPLSLSPPPTTPASAPEGMVEGEEGGELARTRSASMGSAAAEEEYDYDTDTSSDSEAETSAIGSLAGGVKKFLKSSTVGRDLTISTEEAHPPTHRNFTLSSRTDFGLNERDNEGRKGNNIYFFGIIDILQEYNLSKRSETLFKGYILRNDTNTISCVSPDRYANRFIEFISRHIE